ncbi:MAG: LysR family transcriptional regulator [bacterium]|nr:LysR family transcriptional regulator [bacterium]
MLALQALVAVARAGTVGGAARLLDRSQPSISARLAGLEQAWRTRLFRRTPRGMELTPEGARLLPLAEAALGQLEQLDQAAGLPIARPTGLRLGAGDALGRHVLPRALAALLRRKPDLDVRLREGPGPALLAALRDGEIDIALVVRPEVVPDGVELTEVTRSEIDLLVPDGTLPPGRWGVALRSLQGRRLVVLQPGSGFRRHLERAFRDAGHALHTAVEVGNLSLVRRFVAAGLGVAPVPRVAFPESERFPGVERYRLRGIPPVAYARAVRAGVPLPEEAHELFSLLRRG